MANPFVHVELHATDLGRAKDFYGKLFSWQLEDVAKPDGDYTMIQVGEGTGGGVMKNPVEGAPSHWLAYVGVEDVEAAAEKARGLGATVIQEKTKVGNFGWLSLIQDPTGAMLGLWQPAQPA